MKKRILVIFLALLFILSPLFSGCKGGDTDVAGGIGTSTGTNPAVTRPVKITETETLTSETDETTTEPTTDDSQTTPADSEDTSTAPDDTTVPVDTVPDTTTPDTTTPVTTPPVTTAPVEQLKIISGGKANYVIVYPANASSEITASVELLKNSIQQNTGVTLSVRTDKTKDQYINAKEILVGYTAYSESSAVVSKLKYADYQIKSSGNKIIITGRYDESTKYAVNHFIRSIGSFVKNKTGSIADLIIPADTFISGSYNAVADVLPVYSGGVFKGIFNCTEGTQLILIGDTSSTQYSSYLNLLKSSGYTQYATNRISSNYFDIYTSSRFSVHLYYTAYEKTVRIIIEYIGNLPPVSPQSFTAMVQPSISQIGLAYEHTDGTTPNNGMSYVIQLSDGSFIIVDGGFNRDIHAKLLYDRMYELAPDKNNIVIAAWIFTHAHGDHVGAFLKFSSTYATKVKLERIIASFPTKAQADITGEGNMSSVTSQYSKYAGVKVHKAHTGQIYYIRDAKIEVLYTFEDHMPLTLTYFNISSIVFSMNLGGQKTMFLGDAYTTSNDKIVAMYGSYLKSDIVQVAHHGYVGGTVAVYKAIDPTIVLWPSSKATYDKYKTQSYNVNLLTKQNVKKIFVAKTDINHLKLPYTP